MSQSLPLSSEELRQRLEQAEAALAALHQGKADLLISAAGPLLVQLQSAVAAREQARREAERLAREWETTFNAVPDAIWILDAEQRVVRANQAAETLFHCPREAMIGRRCCEIVHDTTQPMPNCPFLRVCRSLRREQMELQRGDRWLTVMVDPILDATGQLTGVVHTLSDVTARKQAEEALRHEHNLLERITAASPSGILVVDHRGQITFANPQAEKILGLSREAITQRTYNDPAWHITNLDGGPLPDANLPFRRVMDTGQPISDVPMAIARPDGQRVCLSVNGAPLLSPSGALEGAVFTVSDITAHLQLEEQLRESQKLEAIGRLAGGVAHDFNNILTVMLMQTSLMEEPNLPSEVKDGLVQIRAAVERAVNLTRQLLLFSRRQAMQPRNLELNAVVTTLVKMLQRIIGEDIRLQLNLHPRPLPTHADAGMLDQVLMNLVVNARDAMPQGGRLVIETTERVLTEAEAATIPDTTAGRYVSLRVTDTGCGIPPQNLSRIFDPFFTTKAVGKGTGLGLATVFGIVKQHRGWITVESELGKGTTFHVFFPALAAADEQQAVAAPPPKGGTETILLVEDDATVRRLTRITLEAHGYQVIEAANGVEALAQWERHGNRIQLLFTDMVMPEGISGRELAERLRARQAGLRVIFTSGYSAEIAGGELALQPGQNFIQKPAAPTELLETVRRCLDG